MISDLQNIALHLALQCFMFANYYKNDLCGVYENVCIYLCFRARIYRVSFVF